MQFRNANYYEAMDYLAPSFDFATETPQKLDSYGNPIIDDESLNFTVRDIGTTTNPMQHQTEALKARIREGASRIEFEFLGAGKGNSQRPTPESFGTKERQDMRELLDVNEMRSATHAGVHTESLAGFTREGFNSEARANVLKEIRRAIDFAGEATKGGAVVFHMNEWHRPMSEIKDPSGKFKAYQEEDKDAIMFAVDSRTGQSAGAIRKDMEIFRPVFITAKDMNLVGKTDENGNVLKEEDWVDVKGNKIEKNASVERLFDRVPKFNEDRTNFEVKKLTYEDIEKETKEWNNNNPNNPRTPAEMVAIMNLENQVLQYKGNSLYHARYYQNEKKELEKLREAKEIINEMKEKNKDVPNWRKRQIIQNYIRRAGREMELDEDPEKYLNEQIKAAENTLRHIHESSASADVYAKEAEERIKNIQSAEKYGLQKTAETIASAGITAMETYNKNKDKYGLKDPIYVAPENWDPRQFGSHPQEYRKIIDKSRETMVNMLKSKGYDEEKAVSLAKQHIKGTLDIGHMNMFRYYFQGSDKEFEKWMLKETEQLVKDGYVAHIHLTDNFGFDDEHITPGQGNVPMKEFLKMLEKHNIKDITVEQGSYNPLASWETMELTNSPIYGLGRRQRFKQVWQTHYGQHAPGFFIAGAYVPSNDWKPWTDLGLE